MNLENQKDKSNAQIVCNFGKITVDQFLEIVQRMKGLDGFHVK
jgi:hypothetical protein